MKQSGNQDTVREMDGTVSEEKYKDMTGMMYKNCLKDKRTNLFG